jgi:serine/threonine-protein kinase
MSQTLGRYTLLGKLATGGMAEVFLARLDGTSGFERRVVIKRVLPQYASHPEFLKLFEQEARFASFLSHPHIATVSDFGVDASGAAYLVMEHVEGASLRTLLRAAAEHHERPDARLICRVFSQVAEALAAVHTATEPSTGRPLDLVHRDVSPENVLLSRQGAVKLADFGIARAMNEVSTTSPDVVRGKLRYLAPEQVLAEPLGPAIDVWALGVSLYEALTLRRPFPEDNEGQTVHAIVNGDFPPLESLRRDLPPELVTVVARCLRREPSARYPDCQDLALDLERIASAGASSLTARVIGNWVERLAPPDELKPLSPERAPLATPQPSQEVPIASTGREVTLEPGPALELATPPAEPRVDPLPLPSRARWPLVVGIFAVLVLVGGVAWRQRGAIQQSAQRQVLVTSTPPGATVKYGTQVLGTTPWAGDLPASHEVVLEVSAPGFQTSRQTLAPGEVAPIAVTLKRNR